MICTKSTLENYSKSVFAVIYHDTHKLATIRSSDFRMKCADLFMWLPKNNSNGKIDYHFTTVMNLTVSINIDQ